MDEPEKLEEARNRFEATAKKIACFALYVWGLVRLTQAQTLNRRGNAMLDEADIKRDAGMKMMQLARSFTDQSHWWKIDPSAGQEEPEDGEAVH